MKSPLGKNEVGKFLSKAAQNAGLQGDGGKLSNHSVRKTCISRLLDANTTEIFVAQLSGHKNLQSLQSYKSASEQHQLQMSSVLSRTKLQHKTNQEEHLIFLKI
jgi:integrase